jgi:autotransporter-associated beta strand protein
MSHPWKSLKKSGTARRRPSHLFKQTPNRRSQRLQLRVEELEPRVVLSTLTWTGALDANWNDKTGPTTNWSGNALPHTGDTLIFPTGAAQLTNVNNTTANNSYILQFTGGAYTISGNAIDLTGTGISDSSASAVSISNNLLLTGTLTASVSGAGPLTLSGVLSQSGAGMGLTKTGTGTLTLGNAANTYSGTTTISAGTLKLGAANAVPSTSSLTDNATLDLNGLSDTVGALSGTGTITSSVAGAVTLTVNGGGSFSGVIQNGSGTAALTVAGSSQSLTLSGANTYSGATTINSTDTLKAGSTTALSASSSFSDAGTLDLASFGNSIGALNGAGTVTSSAAGAVTLTVGGGGSFSGIIQNGSGTVALTVAGSSQTLTLSGANTYSGATTISSTDTLKAGSATALAANSSFSDAGTLDLAGFSNSIGALNGAGTVTNSLLSTIYQIDNGTTAVGFNNTLFSESEDNWVGNVFTAVAGSTVLSSISFQTYSALNATTLPSPFVTAALYTGAPGAGLTLVRSSVCTLPLNVAAGTFVTVPFATPQTLSAGQVFTAALLIDNVPNTTFPFELDNSGSNANSYYDISAPSGNVNTYRLRAPNGPTLNGVNYGATGSSNAPGYLDRTILRVNRVPAALTVTGGGSFSGTIKDGSGDGAMSLIVAGNSQTLTLSGANTYTGTTSITAGTLTVTGGNAIPDGSQVIMTPAAGVMFDVKSSETIGSFTGGGTINLDGSGVILNTGDNGLYTPTYSGLIEGPGGLVKTGIGYLTITGSNTYTGTTDIQAGFVFPQADAAFGLGSAAVTVEVGATLDFITPLNYSTPKPLILDSTGYGTTGQGGILGQGFTIAGNITLGANAVVNSTSPFTLSGQINLQGHQLQINATTGNNATVLLPNTVTSSPGGGSLVVSSGTLQLDGNASGIPITVASGAMLSGTGTVGAITASGLVSPGDGGTPTGVVSLTASGANFSSGGTLATLITGNSASPSYNQLKLGSGTLTLGGTSSLTANLSGLSYAAGAGSVVNFMVINAAASVSGTFGTPSFINQGSFSPTVNYSSSAVAVQVGNVASSWVSDATLAPGAQPVLPPSGTAGGSSQPVTVAVLDTGIDFSNPHLLPNIWINQAEIPASVRSKLVDVNHDGIISFLDLQNPINQGPGKIKDVYHDGYISVRDLLAPIAQGGWATGKVDPADGLVDDIVGWNFVDNNNDPYDQSGHGTYSASLVTAVDPHAVIMPLQILTSSGLGTLTAATAALEYATAHGAQITLNAWVPDVLTPDWTSALTSAEAAGELVVMAAGNDNSAALDNLAQMHLSNVVIVGAVDGSDQLASFSNSGAGVVDLAAPGVDVLGTVAGGKSEAHSGTSASAALVAGDAALAWGLHPTLTEGDIVTALFTGADSGQGLEDGVTGGRVLDIAGTLAVAAQLDPTIVVSSSTSPVDPSPDGSAVVVSSTTTPPDSVVISSASTVPQSSGAGVVDQAAGDDTVVSAALVVDNAAPTLADSDLAAALFAGADHVQNLQNGVTESLVLNIAGTLTGAAQPDNSDAVPTAFASELHSKVLTSDWGFVSPAGHASPPAAWLQQAFNDEAGTAAPVPYTMLPLQNAASLPKLDMAWVAAVDQVSTSGLDSAIQDSAQADRLVNDIGE